jgi:hypothetical protein
MAKKAREFSTKFKLDAVRRMAEATSIVGLAEELGVRRKLFFSGKLAIMGLALQALALLGVRGMPRWAVACVVVGCTTFLLFWDLDNWMLIGVTLMMTGFIPAFRMLGISSGPGAGQVLSAREP